MESTLGKKKVDRIAILVSYDGTSKFLSATAVEPSTGENIATAVRDALVSWNIIDRVGAMSFDTTSSNTGSKSGATVFIQNFLERKLIQLPCRHHMYEIVLKSVFEVKYSATSAPEVPIFNRFAAVWDNLDHELYKCGLDDEIVRSKISNEESEAIKIFCNNQLQQMQIRADYKEFLQLTLTFLGEDGMNFFTCSSTSHARFMGKGLYCLKIFLFREQFRLTVAEFKALREICIFLVKIYIKNWYGCPNAIQAPSQDLQFIKNAIAYAEIDKEVSDTILSKFKAHLWYLTPETTALAFFDPNVSLEEKREMVNCLQSIEPNVKLLEGRRIADPKVLHLTSLRDFVSYETKYFFSAFNLSAAFLQCDPSTWVENEDFQAALDFSRQLFVVNDNAERGVKFMKDYNRILTKNEEQKQLVFQFVEAYRTKFPTHNKSTLNSEISLIS